MQSWDAELYQSKHNFVFEYGQDLVPLLAPQPGERVLDIGCGSGELTKQIADLGAQVVGIDSSSEMISRASKSFPKLEFIQADAVSFTWENHFDAIFSNATLHWIKNQDLLMQNVTRLLRKEGRWVVEFGGNKNCFGILSAVNNVLETQGIHRKTESSFFFPSVGEYTTLLESFGFSVDAAWYFSRPTRLSGENGIADWLEMFADNYFAGIEPARIPGLRMLVQEQLKDTHYRNQSWWADYVRIRVKATYHSNLY